MDKGGRQEWRAASVAGRTRSVDGGGGGDDGGREKGGGRRGEGGKEDESGFMGLESTVTGWGEEK